jgi:hypothetical protein
MSSRPRSRRPTGDATNRGNGTNSNSNINSNHYNPPPPIDLVQTFRLGSAVHPSQHQQQQQVLLGLQQRQQQLALQAYLGQAASQQQPQQQPLLQQEDGFPLPPVPLTPNESTMRLSASATTLDPMQLLRQQTPLMSGGGTLLSPVPSPPTPCMLSDRQLCFLFVKILLKYTEKTADDRLQRRAKAVVADCTHRNRRGEADYVPLPQAVQRRLRRSLGEVHWARAKRCFDVYCSRQGIHTWIHAV